VVASEAEIESSHGAFAQPFTDPGEVVMVDDPAPVAILREVIDRARPLIPGEIDRMQEDIADGFTVADRKEFRIAHRDADGGHDGFATYTIDQDWEYDAIPANRLKVGTFVTATPQAHAALWRYLLDLRLVRSVTVRNRPLDDAIRWLLAEWRHYRIKHVTDALWLSLLDVPAALEARGYLCDGELVLEVDGRGHLLEVSGGAGRCTPSDRPAQISLAGSVLASAYLGGYRLTALRDGMRLRELVPGACVRADSMFRAERDPWCSYGF
jgi:predicted acetyltransferase